MTAPGIGRKLKNARVGKGLAIDDISRDTRIAPRFIEAIETEDYSSLPGLIFTRSFVRQYALILGLDPDPLLDALPKVDENTAPLPNPPAHPRGRSLYRKERQVRALMTFAAWALGVGGVGAVAYFYSNHSSLRLMAPPNHDVVKAAGPVAAPAQAKGPVVVASHPAETATAVAGPVNGTENAVPAGSASGSSASGSSASGSSASGSSASGSSASGYVAAVSGPVTVSLTAHARTWIRLDVDGKTAFMGTLTPNETKEVSASQQIRLQTGNAGALTVSLNGKTLESLGGFGQFRELRLTAEGPEFVRKDPRAQPASDQL